LTRISYMTGRETDYTGQYGWLECIATSLCDASVHEKLTLCCSFKGSVCKVMPNEDLVVKPVVRVLFPATYLPYDTDCCCSSFTN